MNLTIDIITLKPSQSMSKTRFNVDNCVWLSWTYASWVSFTQSYTRSRVTNWLLLSMYHNLQLFTVPIRIEIPLYYNHNLIIIFNILNFAGRNSLNIEKKSKLFLSYITNFSRNFQPARNDRFWNVDNFRFYSYPWTNTFELEFY